MNLMTAMNFNKNEVMEQLRGGNMEVLNGLPASLTLQLGLELQSEQGYVEPSTIDDKAVARVVVDRLKDSNVKEILIKRIEQEERENNPLA